MKTETIAVEGMACAHCELAVQDTLRKLPGIQRAKASKRKKQVVVSYDEALVTRAQMVAAIHATVYRAEE